MFDRDDAKTENFVGSLLKFFLIFIILLAVILTVHYTGILDFAEDIGTTASDSIGTVPSSTTEQTTQTAPTTTPVITDTTTDTPAVSDSTAQTTADTTYPPATIPGYTTPQETTTVKTTESTTLTPTTETTTAVEPGRLDISNEAMAELIEVRYLTIHNDSRPGYKLTSLKNIVVHYVANPGTTADQNWRYFENSKPSVSAHFIIGLEGEIIQCMPLDEVAWAIGTKEGNYTSISIECCHPDDTGKFTDATYESLVRLVSWLCNELGLDRDDVIRHYDYPRQASWGVWHKECPLYYADESDPASHERWEDFKNDLILD